jgi:hypothetical protein
MGQKGLKKRSINQGDLAVPSGCRPEDPRGFRKTPGVLTNALKKLDEWLGVDLLGVTRDRIIEIEIKK